MEKVIINNMTLNKSQYKKQIELLNKHFVEYFFNI